MRCAMLKWRKYYRTVFYKIASKWKLAKFDLSNIWKWQVHGSSIPKKKNKPSCHFWEINLLAKGWQTTDDSALAKLRCHSAGGAKTNVVRYYVDKALSMLFFIAPSTNQSCVDIPLKIWTVDLLILLILLTLSSHKNRVGLSEKIIIK